MSNKFDLTNWNFAFYSTENYKAIISLAAEPAGDSSEPEFSYCPTVLTQETKEVFQTSFKELKKAIDYMNSNYGHWEFMEATGSSSGCSTCEAH